MIIEIIIVVAAMMYVAQLIAWVIEVFNISTLEAKWAQTKKGVLLALIPFIWIPYFGIIIIRKIRALP